MNLSDAATMQLATATALADPDLPEGEREHLQELHDTTALILDAETAKGEPAAAEVRRHQALARMRATARRVEHRLHAERLADG